MIQLIEAFRDGFEQGWKLHWSPFTGFIRALAALWRQRIGEVNHDKG